MDSLEKQRIESQINQLILPYADNYSGPQGYRITNTLTGITEFRPEFMNHLPDGVRVSIEDLVKRLNAFGLASISNSYRNGTVKGTDIPFSGNSNSTTLDDVASVWVSGDFKIINIGNF